MTATSKESFKKTYTGGLSVSMRVFKHVPVATSQIRLLCQWQWPEEKEKQAVPEAVVASRDNQGSVTVEVDSGDWVRVGWECFQTLACFHVPDSWHEKDWVGGEIE